MLGAQGKLDVVSKRFEKALEGRAKPETKKRIKEAVEVLTKLRSPPGGDDGRPDAAIVVTQPETITPTTVPPDAGNNQSNSVVKLPTVKLLLEVLAAFVGLIGTILVHPQT
jgi:hypothetical protein